MDIHLCSDCNSYIGVDIMIELVIALLIVVFLSAYLTYVLGFLTIIPSSLMYLLLFAIAVDIVLFIIHRK